MYLPPRTAPTRHIRPSWDSYLIEVAKAVALRGDCIRDRVGAVLVEDSTHRILSTGFNGSEPGGPSCAAGECERCLSDAPSGSDYDGCVETHAEANALEWWDVFNRAYYGRHNAATTMYITRRPCSDCQDLLRSYGVGTAVFLVYAATDIFIEWLDLTPNKGM